MPALTGKNQSSASRLAEYGARMGELLIRRRAELEARAARIEAELAIKARSEFLANMNHELRTPLNAIIGFATMLRDGEDYSLSAEQQRTYAEYILQSADLLLGHINTLLEVAALESGRVEINEEPIDFASLLEDAVKRAQVRAEAAGVALKLQRETDEICGWGDPERFAQALDHLIQTAVKLSHEGGAVHLRACLNTQGWAEIAVRDEGDGLTKDELAEALEAFKELHRGLDRSFLGPGVGYAVAKTFVEMQGGRFFIESREGQGTLARISLPQAEALYGETHHEDDAEDIAERDHDAA
ncbi:sensor histidine kinase [Hyphococcus sp.]|jgi:two-component system cell cycle sensor histidine kinase PleC|uniref:sensor histidine kinase n=1 Tax=Hyphococcus sp. TaxID=2038636 RepID=UPI003D0F4004